MTDDVERQEGVNGNPPTPSNEGDADIVNRLAHLAALRASGDLSDEEFEAAKRAALSAAGTPDAAGAPHERQRRKRWIAVSAGVALVATLGTVAILALTQVAEKQEMTVEGTFTISNESYDASNEFADPNYTDDGVAGCQGDSGYGDLNSITQVVVTDDHGREVARTQLGSGNDSSGSCVFTFQFDVQEGPEYFVVSVGDRGSSQYTFDELKEPGAVALIIGTD